MNIKRVLFCVFFQTVMIVGGVDFSRIVHDIEISGLLSKHAKQVFKAYDFYVVEGAFPKSQFIEKDIRALYKTGFFSSVKARSIYQGGQHKLEYVVEENPIVEQIEIKGFSRKITIKIHRFMSALLKKPLNSTEIERMRMQLKEYMNKEGYDFFEISSIVFDKQRHSLVLDGRNAVVERIEFIGLERISPFILERDLQVQPGSLFNSRLLRLDRDKLVRSGYFRSVASPVFLKGSRENFVRVVFTVVEKKYNKLSIGLEQDDDDYFGFLTHSHRHVLIHSDSLQLKFQAQLTSTGISFNRYSLGYFQPWVFNTFKIGSEFNVYHKEQQDVFDGVNAESLRQGVYLGLQRDVSDYLLLQFGFKNESVAAIRSRSAVDDYVIQSFNAKLNYDSVQSLFNPKKGKRIWVTYESAGDFLGASLGGVSFKKLISSWANYTALTDKLTLATRLKAGIMFIENDLYVFENTPFVVGGALSVRGYNEQRIPFSGTRMVVFNTEFRRELSRSLDAIVFFDTGTAFQRGLHVDDLHYGYGLGVRFKTPIGPIRFDFSKGEEDVYIHFGLGQLF